MDYHHVYHSKKEQPKRILIVENDRDLIDIYSTRLTVEGFKVKSLTQADQALAVIADFKPDMVLLDIKLGLLDGLDILQAIRQNPQIKNTKVIIITVLAIDDVEKRALSLGALEYLVKTSTILADIVEHVKEHLGMVTPLEEEMLEEINA